MISNNNSFHCKNDPFQNLLSFFTTENEKSYIKKNSKQVFYSKANILHAIWKRLNKNPSNLKSQLKFFFIKKLIYLFLNNKNVYLDLNIYSEGLSLKISVRVECTYHSPYINKLINKCYF